jgi:hypothetical protein
MSAWEKAKRFEAESVKLENENEDRWRSNDYWIHSRNRGHA